MTGTRGDTIRVESELARTMLRLKRLPAHERAYAACTVINELDATRKVAAGIRGQAIDALRGDGVTFREIADMMDEAIENVQYWHAKWVSASAPAAPSEG